MMDVGRKRLPALLPGLVLAWPALAEVEEGISHNQYRPIALERALASGLDHRAGALSMARLAPDTATSSFFIVTQDSPELDFSGMRNADGQGFAVFGQVQNG